MKQRAGYGGGYRIQEEALERAKARNRREEVHEEEEQLPSERDIMTKDDILRQLNLNQGTDEVSKGATQQENVTRELCDNIQKEIEKLRRHSENL